MLQLSRIYPIQLAFRANPFVKPNAELSCFIGWPLEVPTLIYSGTVENAALMHIKVNKSQEIVSKTWMTINIKFINTVKVFVSKNKNKNIFLYLVTNGQKDKNKHSEE